MAWFNADRFKFILEGLFAGVLCFLVYAAVVRTNTKEAPPSAAADSAQHIWEASILAQQASPHSSSEGPLTPFGYWAPAKHQALAAVTNNCSATVNGNANLTNVCAYLRPQKGCCGAKNPVIPPFTCTTVSAEAAECQKLYVSYFCSSCVPDAGQCSGSWTKLKTVCTSACPTQVLPPIANSSAPDANCTSLLPAETTPLALTVTFTPTTVGTLDAVTLPAQNVTFIVTATSTNPPNGVRVAVGTAFAVIIDAPVPDGAWNFTSPTTWVARVSAPVFVTNLLSQPQWIFPVNVSGVNMRPGSSLVTFTSPNSLTINVNTSSAPAIMATVNTCGAAGSTSGTTSLAAATTQVTQANCDCPGTCSYVSVTIVIFRFFLINAQRMFFNSFLVFGESISLTRDTSLQMQGRSSFTFSEIFVTVFRYAIIFVGTADNQITFSRGCRASFQRGVELQGPVVNVLGNMEVGNASTCTVNGSTVSLGNDSVVTIASTSILSVKRGRIHGRGCRMHGGGRFEHRGGRFEFFQMVMVVHVVIYQIVVGAARRLAVSANRFCGAQIDTLTLTAGSQVELDLYFGLCTAPGSSSAYSAEIKTFSAAANSILYLSNVTTQSLPVFVNTTLTWDPTAYLSVNFLFQPSAPSLTTVMKIAVASAADCTLANKLAEPITTSSGVIPVGTYLTPLYVAPHCLVQVYVPAPAATTTTSSTTNNGLVWTTRSYQSILNKDCVTFTSTVATDAMVGAGYDRTRFQCTTSCASTLLNIVCNGATSTDADAYCQRILNDINTPGSSLNTQFQPASTSGGGGSGSNNGLYGLLALIAIPVIIVIAAVAWFLRPKSTPDARSYDEEEQPEVAAPKVEQIPPAFAAPAYAAPMAAPMGATPYTTPATTPLMYRS